MERVDGNSLGQLPAERISDDLLRQLWTEVDSLHRAGIATGPCERQRDDRGRRAAVADRLQLLRAGGRQRPRDLDLAELLASLATLVGADRAVSSAAAVIGARQLAAAVPLLQPLALSAATGRPSPWRRLLADTRSAAAAASGLDGPPLARLQRVRPRTLLAIAAAAGAFYFVLPQLAQVGSSWQRCNRRAGPGCLSSSPAPC